jgi:5-methylcytosine-specific restriction endonuclease McrA
LEVFDLPSGQAIGYNENFREPALELDRKAIDRTQPGDKRHGMRRQARACTFKRALQLSFHRAMPVRVIVVEGVQDERAELGKESARVKVRKLDTENWFMHAYDNDSGNTLLVRGIPLPSTQNVTTEVEAEVSVATVPESAGPMYVDQFSAPVTASIQEATVLVRERSAVVREAVLRRAGGVCELCNEPGFVTAAGSVYLETHHVVPLSENGPDHPANVVAICPKDHRRAHYAVDREEIAIRLTARLVSLAAERMT